VFDSAKEAAKVSTIARQVVTEFPIPKRAKIRTLEEKIQLKSRDPTRMAEAVPKLSKNNHFGYVNVVWGGANKKFLSSVLFKGERVKLGNFTSAEQAARAHAVACGLVAHIMNGGDIDDD
jgi:hypothetical protein